MTNIYKKLTKALKPTVKAPPSNRKPPSKTPLKDVMKKAKK